MDGGEIIQWLGCFGTPAFLVFGASFLSSTPKSTMGVTGKGLIHDYNRRYDEMVSRYEATKAERDALAGEIRQRGIRRREFERFITTLESLPDEVTDFSEDLWGSLVEYLTVYAKDDLRFMLPCEVEITA